MSESKASRTLLKSPPELWSEVSTATSLQRHMDQFGEIRITKLQPETAVAWEGEHARGTITLEVSGWGTKVSLTAEPVGVDGVDGLQPEAAAQVEPEPDLGGVELDAAGDQVEPARVVDRIEPERDPDPVKPAPASDRVEPEALDDHVEPTHKPRWTRWLAQTFRRWFSPPRQEADPVQPEREQPDRVQAEPQQPDLVAPEPQQAADPPAPLAAQEAKPVAPEPGQPPPSGSPTVHPAPASQAEPAPQLDDTSRAALDAALDSLGQAHHRPFSRA
jgi:hypothetical protein